VVGSLDDWCDAKAIAVAMRSLSPARCRFARWCPAGSVASMEGVPTRHVVVGTMSPCPVVVGESPVKGVSPVVPVD